MAERTENVEPIFNLPPGLSNLKYTVTDDFGDREEEIVPNDEIIEGDVWMDESDGTGGLPDTPEFITIVDQVVRTLPGGGQVVDVTIELPDLPGGDRYDIRVTTK